MTAFDLVVRNGRVATAADLFEADIGVKDGVIVALGRGLPKGTRDIDAAGRLVLPGGIDSHCHVEQTSSSGIMTADDFYSATRSAAGGGTTTIIPFAAQHRGMSLRTVVRDYHACATPKAVIDYAFHLIVSDPTETVLGQELPALIADGYTSFKIYTTYDMLKLNDRQVLDVLSIARREGALTMVHAENHDIIAWLSDKLMDAGLTQPKFHAVAHARTAEREATHRVISLAELVDVPVLIVHVSSAEAIEQIRIAQNRGIRVFGETCPQYLYLTEDDLDKPGFEGAKCMCSPPPRDKANQQKVWDALSQGVFQVFSSDHAPYRYDDPEGKMKHGSNPPFKKVANGVPGLEARLPLLFHGISEGRIDLHQFVGLAATNAAKLYGIYPRKGTIAIGSDADLAIWDPEKEVTIRQADLHDAMDYTPYEGLTVKGWPVITISRGEVVAEDGKVTEERGRGQFLRCDRSPLARSTGRRVTGFDPVSGRLPGL
ncbi:dihydropyrimidinase [Stella humosa]|uniref:Dihydropyrimidinase n=1 Tax=Stella humosa TaxID=94 RepID=A0A3N1MKF5_9PROT|nr:dihydropyrimidinase [Stella humosa]ROQ01456.1 dihydropyrimidinase [Stella humosa]BBK31833.1 dihydropyrimidinase [Stella humosa]